MSKRDPKLFVQDMLESIAKIEQWTKFLSLESFKRDPLVVDAVVRNLEVIGEASKHIPEELRSQYPSIPWRRITGFRNVAIHDYFGVDLETVWTVVTQGIKEIKPHLQSMFDR